MKIFVKMSCGHGQLMTINGCAEHISKKIKYFEERAICKHCFMKKQMEEMTDRVEVRMTYHAYKTHYRKFPCEMESYNKADTTIIVYLPKKFADRLREKEAEKEKARLEREEKKRLAEIQKTERAAARAAAFAAKKAKQDAAQLQPAKPKKPKKLPVPQQPLELRPPEALLFLKRLAGEYNKMYQVAVTNLEKRDVRVAYGRLNLFYSSYGKKEWEKLVSGNDIKNLPAHQIVQLANQVYETTEKDRLGCVKR